MDLNELSPIPGSKRPRKRVGRGIGSGTGKTSGRGQKGQRSRSGGGVRPGFEGGQMPLQRRIPKRGFTNARFRKRYQEVNVRSLSVFEAGSEVTLETLAEHRLVSSKRAPVKLLGDGELDRALTIKVAKVTASARAKVEAAGGTIQEA